MTAIPRDFSPSPALWADFLTLCGFGGRLCGTPSEARAREFLAAALGRVAAAHGGTVSASALDYDGWRGGGAWLDLADGSRLAAEPLVWSPAAADQDLPVVDLGRGGPDEVTARAGGVAGALVLARHEYMFSARTVHRSRKFAAAVEAGAAAFAMVGAEAGRPVTGGAGFGGLAAVPAVGLAPEAAARAAAAGRVRLTVITATQPSRTGNLFLDLPGRGDEWVVVSAHIDGHDLAQSAMDNATGLAVALEAARLLAPHVAGWRRGLRVCLYSLEEWGLLGSERHLAAQTGAEHRAVALDINLDSVAGDPHLAAMTSGFPALEPFLAETAAGLGMDLDFHRPLLRNSDHYNYARAGIPAFRLVAGFERPDSNLRYVLTDGDTADRVDRADLERAARLVAATAARACAGDRDLRAGEAAP